MYFSNLNIGKRVKDYNSIQKNNKLLSSYHVRYHYKFM